MLFNSVEFIMFFSIVCVIYFSIPDKYRWILLLGSSYYFYMSWNFNYAILIFISTMVTYASGIFLDKIRFIDNPKIRINVGKTIVVLSLVINLGILFYFKYLGFTIESIQHLLSFSGIKWTLQSYNLLLPVGISFYTFQALSYTFDCYKGNTKTEYHFGRYALFVSFFPQLVAGPIERSSVLLPQFRKVHKYEYERIRDGILLIGWGMFKKLVIADRIAILVDTVFNQAEFFVGFQLVVAAVFFTFQIYCDFSSYSDIAIGTAKVLGYDLMKNFDKPFLSKSIQEFWTRWHISLSTWFRDYLYIPLGGSRVSQFKHYRNLMLVFLISGLWHGASWNFILWGLIHAFFQIMGILLKEVRDKFVLIFRIDRNTFSHRLYKGMFTFSLVSFAFIFFRANSIGDAFYFVSNMFIFNPEIFFNGDLYKMGLDIYNFNFAVIMLILLMIIQLFQEKLDIRNFLSSQHIVFRWAIYYLMFMMIAIFGVFGTNEFIYFQF